MNKAFTLIELLAVVVILAIILVISIPQINKVIEDSKYNAYSNTVKSIINAAELYVVKHGGELPVNPGDRTFISLDDLKEEKLISNIKDTRTGEYLTKGDIAVDKISEGNYKYTFMPSNIVKNNLLLWIDGRDYRNNTSVWKDLSGYGNNVTLKNISYTNTSGSDKNGGVVYDGVNDYALNTAITIPPLTNWTIEFKASFRSDAVGKWIDLFGDSGSHAIIFHSTAGLGWYINYENGISYLSSSNIKIGTNIPVDTITTFAIKCEYIDTTNANVYFYVNGVLSYTYNNRTLNPSFNGFKLRFVGTSQIDRIVPWTLYYYRLYNRNLSDSEILQNYNASI